MTTPANAGFIERTTFDDEFKYGAKIVDSIDGDIPALIAFGGESTRTPRNGNYYAGILWRALDGGGVKNFDIFAGVFCVDIAVSRAIRRDAFRRAGRRLIPAPEPEITTNHIEYFYNTALRPRLFDDKGRRFDTDTAVARIRKLKLFGHCHGAMIIQKMANIMTREMHDGGYTDDEIKYIQQQLLVIQYAPVAPLEHPIFPTISFASSADISMNRHENLFSRYMLRHAQDMPPAFFVAPRGNIFIADLLKTNPKNEHDLDNINDVTNPKQITFTENGIIIYSAMRNALVRAAQHSRNGGELPDVKTLTNGRRVNFDKLKQNGDLIYDVMLENARLVQRREK